MLQESHPYDLGKESLAPNRDLAVVDEYTGEGVRFAMEDMTGIRFPVVRTLA